MPVIRDGRFTGDDWPHAAGAAIPDDAAVTDLRCGNRTGAVIAADSDPAVLDHRLGTLDLVIIRFAATGDGRGLSLAHMLRRLGYRGELRACGPLLPDQYHDLSGCGFDSIEISDELAARHGELEWHKAWRRFDCGYQQRSRSAKSILSRRHGAAAVQTTP